MEATAAVFDRAVDSWAGGRRRMLPIAGGGNVPGALEELPGAGKCRDDETCGWVGVLYHTGRGGGGMTDAVELSIGPTDRPATTTTPIIQSSPTTEEWVGGGQALTLANEGGAARRLVWRARGHSTWLAEFAAGRDLPRNGMQMPHGVLSRDALCVEATDSPEAAALLWTLAPNLVLRCVAYRRPGPASASAAQQGHGQGQGRRGAGAGVGAGEAGAATPLASLFDHLPRNEQAEALALRPPAGSEYPSCCAFVVERGSRHLVIGYQTGKVGVCAVFLCICI